ncbi:MAG: radical SAM protein [Elusimicrobiota bacterium]|jgi:MoaA/NifB/PqqE/SkfB family radical SAM enzyme
MSPIILPESLGASSADLKAPLYVAWQLTNECSLSCLHCIEESGPGKAFPDELAREEALRVVDQIIAADIPYVAFSGGEPLLRTDFFELLGRLKGTGTGVKVETNGQLLDAPTCARLAECEVKAVQVSMDGVSEDTVRMLRPGASLKKVTDGIANLRRAGIAVEVNFAPTRFNVGQIAQTMAKACELGAYAFYTGRLMYTGNAVGSWGRIAASEAQYAEFFAVIKAQAKAYEGRMRVCFHEMGIVEELRYRLEHPAALFIILPDGRVKLINALPFTCGSLRTDNLIQLWQRVLRAWKEPRVASFVDELTQDPGAIAKLHQWVEL